MKVKKRIRRMPNGYYSLFNESPRTNNKEWEGISTRDCHLTNKYMYINPMSIRRKKDKSNEQRYLRKLLMQIELEEGEELL